jgi:hypothetical protein
VRSRRDLGRLVASLPAPDELGAQRRAWRVVRTAFAERQPVRWPRRRYRPLAALALGAAVVAAALTPPGRAVLESVREAIGEERVVGRPGAERALFRLPTRGRLLVDARRGAWIVQRDGSRRPLGRYRETTWSPHGLYVAATRRDELLALDPKGTVRWTLARPNVRLPRWAGSRVDTRIAYVSGSSLRLVAGDGRGDRLLARSVRPVAPAWQPGSMRILAYVDRRGRIAVVDVQTKKLRGVSLRGALPEELAWSTDARRLYALSGEAVRVLDARARPRGTSPSPAGFRAVTLAPRPGSAELALVRRSDRARRSEVVLLRGRREVPLFAGPGRITDLAWSPDGRWLLLGWRSADQWLFLDAERPERLQAFAGVTRQFTPGGRVLVDFPKLPGAAWCCP